MVLAEVEETQQKFHQAVNFLIRFFFIEKMNTPNSNKSNKEQPGQQQSSSNNPIHPKSHNLQKLFFSIKKTRTGAYQHPKYRFKIIL